MPSAGCLAKKPRVVAQSDQALFDAESGDIARAASGLRNLIHSLHAVLIPHAVAGRRAALALAIREGHGRIARRSGDSGSEFGLPTAGAGGGRDDDKQSGREIDTGHSNAPEIVPEKSAGCLRTSCMFGRQSPALVPGTGVDGIDQGLAGAQPLDVLDHAGCGGPRVG